MHVLDTIRGLVVSLLLRAARGVWAPVNTNDFQCLDDAWVASLPDDAQDEFYAIPARFDDRLGMPPRYTVDDERVTSYWHNFLTNTTEGKKFNFFGYGVAPGTPRRAVLGDSSNVGWVGEGELDGALVMEFNGWDSQYITTWVATILLKEQIGYNVVHLDVASIDYTSIYSNPEENGNFTRDRGCQNLQQEQTSSCSPPTHVNMEKWALFHKMHTDKYADGLEELGDTGFTGIEGAYTSDVFVDIGRASDPPFSALWWEAYSENDDALGALNYTLSADEAATSRATCLLEAADDVNWVHWFESDCDDDGFFVTEACAERQAAGRPCGTLILMTAAWANELLVIVVGLRLPMRLAVLGYDGAFAHVEARLDAGLPFFFYFYQPDVWLTNNPTVQRVTFPTPDFELFERGTTGALDMRPTDANRVDCDSPLVMMSKWASADLQTTAPHAHAMLVKFKLLASDIEWLNAKYQNATDDPNEGSDGMAHYRAACAWVQENYPTWSTWIDEYACDGGYYYSRDTSQCEMCPVGTAAAGASDSRFDCVPCGKGTYAPDVGLQHCIGCELGTFAEREGETQCTPCPMHAVCSPPACPVTELRCPGAVDVVIEPGYWRTQVTSLITYACPSKRACPGGNGTQLCARGHEVCARARFLDARA